MVGVCVKHVVYLLLVPVGQEFVEQVRLRKLQVVDAVVMMNAIVGGAHR